VKQPKQSEGALASVVVDAGFLRDGSSCELAVKRFRRPKQDNLR
jgi:hypothetical protein